MTAARHSCTAGMSGPIMKLGEGGNTKAHVARHDRHDPLISNTQLITTPTFGNRKVLETKMGIKGLGNNEEAEP